MAHSDVRLAMSAAVLAMLATAALAAGTPQGNCMQDALEKHNAFRAQHGAPALKWNAALAARERVAVTNMAKVTTGCKLVHSGSQENLYMHSVSKSRSDICAAAVEDWYSELQYYIFDDQQPYTLSMANLPKNKRPPAAIGHFTQVVWKDAREVGCWTETAPSQFGLPGCIVVGCAYDDGNSEEDKTQLANVLQKGTPVGKVITLPKTDQLPNGFCGQMRDEGSCLGGTTWSDTGKTIASLCPVSCGPVLKQQEQEWLDAAARLGPVDGGGQTDPGTTDPQDGQDSTSDPTDNTDPGSDGTADQSGSATNRRLLL